MILESCVLQANITVLSKDSKLLQKDFSKTEVKVEEHELEDEHSCSVIIAWNVLLHTELLQTAASALADGACILAREKPETKGTFSNGFRLETVFEKTFKDEKLLLLRKVMAAPRLLVSNWNQKVHYVDYKIPPRFHILSQMNLIPIL
jgi:hypothetical protein